VAHEQLQEQGITMPLQSTSGAASYDAFGGGVAAVPKYIEDYFSTFLFTGNASTQTINNGIDLAGKGGLVWTKNRTNAYDNYLYDTARGVNKLLLSNNTIDQQSTANTLTAFNSNGFTLGNSDYGNITNGAAAVSWTWAKAPKFFDIVTYTGNGANRTISHNLGSEPGCIIIKRTDTTDNWIVYHRSLGNDYELFLNLTYAKNYTNDFNFTSPTSTTFAVNGNPAVNASGGTYVAYLFAHDAGGFGLTGTDNVISCGSFTTDGSGQATVNLGYEPQWVLFKPSSTTGDWTLLDTMRGWVADGTNADKLLYANKSDAEVGAFNMGITATGFDTRANLGASQTHIYIAIRRGPMKVPTDATKVFAIDTRHNTTPAFVSNFPVDMSTYRAKSGSDWYLQSRLTPNFLLTNSTAAENASPVFSATQFASNTGWGSAGADVPDVFSYMMQRAPSFFDEVCYTGTGTDGAVVTHNLTVAPELVIIKGRTNVNYWAVGHSFGATTYGYALLNDTGPGVVNDPYSGGVYFTARPTSTTMTLASQPRVNGSAVNYVAYLFATCPGVSKVTNFTGTGALQTINCGFAAGSRFVLIKRTDSTGDWYVWDSARGLSSSTDPYLLLNSTAAEVTGTNWVDTTATGFQVTAASGNNVNINGASYIALAIA
jgi:hypothetical protein